MTERIHTKNIFKTAEPELLKRSVTAKVEKIVNMQAKKQIDNRNQR